MKATLLLPTCWIFCLFFPLTAMLHAQNYVTTYAGSGNPGFENGDTSVATFNRPFGMTIDPAGNLYIADAYNHCIRKIGIDGQVSTFAGTGQAGYLDGPAEEARFNQPLNICFDDEGNMYVSDFINQRIRMISTDMEVTTIAGAGSPGYSDGPALLAQFNYPRGICVDDTGNIYIGDSWNHRVRRISADHSLVTTWAGGGSSIGVQSEGDFKDASDTAARFYTPCELSIDPDNNIFVADAYNHRIRKIDPDRMVTTHAGKGGHGPDGGGFRDGPRDSAQFDVPTACYVMADGKVFVGDGSNYRVRLIEEETVSTFAGTGEEGFDNGPDTLATFNFPRATVFDYSRNRLYVVDYGNHAVRIIHVEEDITGAAEIPENVSLKVFPNPFRTSLNIAYELPEQQKSNLRISLFDLMGNQIAVIPNNGLANGEVRISAHLEDLPAGLYFLVLRTNYSTVAKRISKLN